MLEIGVKNKVQELLKIECLFLFDNCFIHYIIYTSRHMMQKRCPHAQAQL